MAPFWRVGNKFSFELAGVAVFVFGLLVEITQSGWKLSDYIKIEIVERMRRILKMSAYFLLLIFGWETDVVMCFASIRGQMERLFYFISFRNSSFVNPACCMIARRVPFWIVLWRGTVILCLLSVRYRWLPFWWTILKPALFRIFRSLRYERVGSFLDSYLHQLSFPFKLV